MTPAPAELVDKWRRFADSGVVDRFEAGALRMCANELAASLAAHGRVEVTDSQCNALIAALDQYARGKSAYEYGLPIYHDDAMPAMREVIRKTLEKTP